MAVLLYSTGRIRNLVPARLWLPLQLLNCGGPRAPLAIRTFVACLLLAFGKTQAAPPDVKYFFPAGGQRSQTLEVVAAGDFAAWPPQTWVDRAGLSIAPGEKGKLTVAVSPDAMPGLYWIRLADAEGASAPRPFVVGLSPEAVEQEPNDDFRQPQLLAGPTVVVSGRLNKGNDVDVFAVPVEAGATLVVSVDASRTLGSPVDALVQILTSDGAVLSQNDDAAGLDPRATYVATETGTLLVRVFGFPVSPDTNIGFTGGDADLYRLTITSGAYALASWPMACQRDALQPVELIGWNLSERLRRLAPRATADDAATLFDIELANSLRLPIEPHPVLVEREPNSDQSPQRVELPATISGRFESPRDVDAFAFTGKQGEAWAFSIESRTLGYESDAVLELKNAAAELVARVDDVGEATDASLSATIPADGEYRILASELFGHYGEPFFYRLRATKVVPDFKLSLEQHSYQAQVGQMLELPVAIERRFEMKGEIEIAVAGLPPEVEVAAVTSKPGDASASAVKLIVIAKSGGFSGPIRVVGKSLAEPGVTRTADAPIPGRVDRIADIWLSVK